MLHFLSSERLSGRKVVTSGKANFKLDIRQNKKKKKIKKMRISRVCVVLKTIWSHFTLIKIKLR